MQDKMKRLLDQIGMNTDYLEKASIKKIVVYDNNKLWNFIIENDKILPVYIYTELINKIKINFSTIEDIKLSVIVREDNDEYINDGEGNFPDPGADATKGKRSLYIHHYIDKTSIE